MAVASVASAVAKRFAPLLVRATNKALGKRLGDSGNNNGDDDGGDDDDDDKRNPTPNSDPRCRDLIMSDVRIHFLFTTLEKSFVIP